MDPYVKVFSVIFLVSLFIPAVLYLLRRFFFRCGRQVRHISGTTFSLFASLYAFFLGFCVATLWNDFGVAKTVVTEEANALHGASCFSREFNDSGGFRKALALYAQSVIDEEWPEMDRNLAMAPPPLMVCIARKQASSCSSSSGFLSSSSRPRSNSPSSSFASSM